jgi:Ser/Thr protein kinase RdoA (MazF antagonist)
MEAERAIALSRALAASLGIDCAPRVLADRSHVVLALDPHPVVARVAVATSTTRVGFAWLAREIAIAAHLYAAGVPATRPTTEMDPGPHVVEEAIVTLWHRETGAPHLDARLAGARFAEVHRALARFDTARLPLWGVMEEARAVMPRATSNGLLDAGEVRRLEAGWARSEALMASARTRTVSFQAVHGDAHLGNVFATTRGPLWTDWEDACVAPLEWDLATLVARNVMFGEETEVLADVLAGYDHDYDRDLARELVGLRNLQVIPWLVVFAERQPELLARARMRLARVEA